MALQATNLQFDYAKYGFRDEENMSLSLTMDSTKVPCASFRA